LRVQPVPTPFSIPLANKNNIKLGGSNQNDILFNLGNLYIYIYYNLNVYIYN
jgi:hypothetical protein